MKRVLTLAIPVFLVLAAFPIRASAAGSNCSSIKAKSANLLQLSTQESLAAFKLQSVLMNQKIEQFYKSRQISGDEYRSYTAYVFASSKPHASSVPVLVTLMNRLVAKKLIPNKYFPAVIALGEKSDSDSLRSNQLVIDNQKCFSKWDVTISKSIPSMKRLWEQIMKPLNLITSN